ncbi:hypothetical protein O0L34_g19322 [Tuta absoluta]|nr:hypothetical protein O0L34_g19322 [Tuta absoluta]
MQCKKCKQFMSAKEETVKCQGQCEGIYHKKCADKMKSFKGGICCSTCKKNEDSPKVVPRIEIDPKTADATTILAEVNKKLEIIYITQSKIDALTESVEFLSEQYEQMKEEAAETKSKIKSMEQNTFIWRSTQNL